MGLGSEADRTSSDEQEGLGCQQPSSTSLSIPPPFLPLPLSSHGLSLTSSEMLYVELGITWKVHRPNIYRQCPFQNSCLNQQISECGPPSLSSANLLRFYYKCRFSGSTWISWIRNPGGKTQQSVLTSLPGGSDTPKSEDRWPALHEASFAENST